MNLDQLTLPIETRTSSETQDLALSFGRVHWRALLGLAALFGVPALAVGHGIAVGTHLGAWGHVWLFLLGSPFLGATLAVGVGHQVFGTPFSIAGALSLASRRLVAWFIATLPSRAVVVLGLLLMMLDDSMGYLGGAISLGLLAPLTGVRQGFTAEIVLLERSPLRRVSRRATQIQRYYFGSLVGRVCSMGIVGSLALTTTFVLVDQSFEWTLGVPLFLGKLSSSGTYFLESLRYDVLLDPWFPTVVFGLMWLIYPVLRIAWFLDYLDLRIRKEAWDIELEFRRAVRRVEGVSP